MIEIINEKNNIDETALLARLGQRIRNLRKQQGLTIKELASKTGLSLRFLSQLEAGEGNIALSRLAYIANALEIRLSELLLEVEETHSKSDRLRTEIDTLLVNCNENELMFIKRVVNLALGQHQQSAIALLGLRGAGKTTIGKKLAAKLTAPFWELDEKIEDMAGLNLSEIFALHGETYYRRLETQALAEVLSRSQLAIIALPGGIVNNLEAFSLTKQHCLTIWLKAKPEDHMERVLKQGDRRPMANRPNAMAELRTILASREPFYKEANLSIDTSLLGIDKSVDSILSELAPLGWIK
ncbi:MAG: helix-turn-helix domain-containing protein [Acidobacteria bacterium]|nr:helix-turn-helix domain-containing protein [Acidobacteriota bacterium]